MVERHAPGIDEDGDEAGGPGSARFASGRIVDERVAPLDDALLKDLSRVLAHGEGGESDVPAGFTYVGQFIAHDLSFEKVLALNVTRFGTLPNKRSPALDLDSLYGRGPENPPSEGPSYYEADGLHLREGTTVDHHGQPDRAGFDLPRTGADAPLAEIPDRRNDENLAIAQIHVAFIRFHNAVVDALPENNRTFDEARKVVTKHYQWMVRHDFLPKVCDEAVVDKVFGTGRSVIDVEEPPTMPIEFSIAAFRFGHSMLRPNYSWNDEMDDGFASLGRLFALSANSGDLGGRTAIPSSAIADYRRLFDFAADGHEAASDAALVVPKEKFNRAMAIDTSLVLPLAALPPQAVDTPEPIPPSEDNLAYRDLLRAKRRGVVTGQRMVEFCQGRGLPITELPDDLGTHAYAAPFDRLSAAQLALLGQRTPLWFYVLREAEVRGNGKLTGVGAQIVVEVIHRAMQLSSASIVNEPDWRPELGPDSETFRMTDLLITAFGKDHLQDPLGP
jgi:hypothetical protein